MKKGKFDSSVLLLALIVALVGGGVVLAVQSFQFDPIERAVAGDSVINTLFVIEKDGRPFSSYVLMFYPATRRAAVFDVPGSIGGVLQRVNRVDRIDAVYDPGRIAPFKNEIERLLGIEIPFSFVMTLENLGKITDLMRGVEVFIPSAVSDFHYGHILFPSGRVFLDGDKARVYVTYELPYESAELVSARRHQFFMSFLRRLGEQNQYLGNPQVARLFHSLFESGTNRRLRARLFDEIARVNIDRASIQTVRGDVREVSGQELLFPHWNGSLIREVVSHTMKTLSQTAESGMVDRVFTVEVLNGTTVTGLAGRTAEILEDFGYNVIFIGNADRNDHDRTLIIDRSGHEEMARVFGGVIRSRNILFDSQNQHTAGQHLAGIDLAVQNFAHRSDFILILGRDFNGRYVTN
ncbi:MAG: LCP family protein [Treponema sp.]|nr:LCP family protein [Treponema sp.]